MEAGGCSVAGVRWQGWQGKGLMFGAVCSGRLFGACCGAERLFVAKALPFKAVPCHNVPCSGTASHNVPGTEHSGKLSPLPQLPCLRTPAERNPPAGTDVPSLPSHAPSPPCSFPCGWVKGSTKKTEGTSLYLPLYVELVRLGFPKLPKSLGRYFNRKCNTFV